MPGLVDSCIRVVKATATNQIAIVAPALYVKLTHQTGRGEGAAETVDEIVEYFEQCYADYMRMLSVPLTNATEFLRGKTLLEYGPGDLPGVALLMVAHGADKVICVDRFPLVSVSEKNAAVLERLCARLPEPARARAQSCFKSAGSPRSGFDSHRIDYRIKPSGLSGLRSDVDLVFSRAVLEHVNDLFATFADMQSALKQDGIAIHQVDLKSHGLHRSNPLDFLSWPPLLWNLMYSHKGVPNRWRVDRYREAIAASGLAVETLEATAVADAAIVREVRPQLAAPFRDLSDADLSWLGFWLVGRKRGVAESVSQVVAQVG